jgi:WD40 repeat protein
MAEERSDSTSREAYINEVIAAYLADVQAGGAPSAQQLLAQHPDIAPELASFLADRKLFTQAARDLAPPGPRTTPFAPSRPATSAPVTGAAAPWPLTIRYFGDYELLGEIARGGMGVVYKARQVSLNRLVALKLLLAGQLATAEEVQRFRGEAEKAANLDHPNIVPIYEVGEHEGRHYFSMRLIVTGSLTQNLPRYRADHRVAARLLTTAAHAVHYAHQQGILHRDLKPGNILIDGLGRPHVTDFGLAKRVQGDGSVPTATVIAGTPSYMAPEQAAGRRLTRAADIYSLGAILYQILTGRPPFQGGNLLEVLQQIQQREPQLPRQLNPRVNRDLEIICLKCLDKDPHRRYATAEALAEDLEHWLAGKPIKARPVGKAERLWRWCRRNPVMASLSGAAAVLLGVVMVVVTGYVVASQDADEKANLVRKARQEREIQEASVRQERVQREAQFRQEREQREKQAREEQKQRDEKSRAERYVQDMRAAHEAWQAGDTARVRSLLASYRPGPEAADLRAWEWFYLDALTHGMWAAHGHNDPVLALAWSADGSRLASADAEGKIKVWDATTSQETSILRAYAGAVQAISWAPDGKRLASAGADSPNPLHSWPRHAVIKVWNIDTGKEAITLPAAAPGDPHSPAPAWSPDGQRLAVLGSNGEVHVWELSTTKDVLTLRAHLGGIAALAWNRDGTRLASLGTDGLAKLWDVATGKVLLTLRGAVDTFPALPGVGEAGMLAWTADGKQVLVARGGKIHCWESATGGEIHRPALPSNWGVVMATDGTKVAWTDKRNGFGETIFVWDIDSGKELMRLRDPPSGSVPLALPHMPLAWSPDGRRLARGAGDGMIRVWQMSAARKPMEIIRTGLRGVPTWSHEGRTIWVPGPQGTIRALDTVTGEVSRTLGGVASYRPGPSREDQLALVLSSPDGHRLASASAAGAIRVWDTASGQILHHLGGIMQPHTSNEGLERRVRVTLAWSVDGKRLASSSSLEHGIQLWDVVSGEKVITFPGHAQEIRSLAWSRDGKRLASAGEDGVVKIWDAAGGKESTTFPYSRPPRSLATSPQSPAESLLAWSADSRQLAVSGGDGSVTVWDAANGREVLRLSGLQAPAYAVDWSPDGRRVAAVGGDGTVNLWEPASGQQILNLRAAPSPFSLGVGLKLAWSPDGRALAVADHETSQGAAQTTVTIWDSKAPAQKPRVGN